jgi:hypothetical protein
MTKSMEMRYMPEERDHYPWIDQPDVGNLLHVLGPPCTDPDCELHNISVAIEEEVISPTNMAYWLCGVFALGQLVEPFLTPDQYKVAIDTLTMRIPIGDIKTD